MRFSRYPKHEDRGATPRRLAHARKWVAKDKEQIGLFPELARYQSAEERIANQDAGFAHYWQELRDGRARNWRQARAELLTLPPIRRAGLAAYWQRARCPGDPVYLLGMIRDARKPAGSFWARLARLRRLELVGAGRLPRETVFAPIKRPGTANA